MNNKKQETAEFVQQIKSKTEKNKETQTQDMMSIQLYFIQEQKLKDYIIL